jgi:ABC-type multidrug transport system fused ATPase/permease subunit
MTALATTTVAYAFLAGPLFEGMVRAARSGSDRSFFDRLPSLPGGPIALVAATLLAVTVARAVASYAQRLTSARVGQDVVRQLRERMYTHLLHAVPSVLVSQRRGEIAARLSNDVMQVQTLVASNLVAIAGDAVTLIGLMLLAFRLDTELACIALIAIVPIAFVLVRFASVVRRAQRRVWEQYGELSSDAAELVGTVPVIRAYGAEANAARSFAETARELEKRNVDAQRWSALGGAAVQLLGGAALVSALILSAARLSSGDLAVDTFVSFFAAMAFVYRPVQGLGATVHRIASGFAAVDRVEEVLALPTQEEERADAVELDRGLGEGVELSGVRYAYEYGAPVLDGVDLRIEPGESVAIVGASGEGKSTLLMILLGLVRPNEGTVTIGGIEVQHAKRESWRRRFAWVTQEPLLFADTVLANVALADPSPDRERAMRALEAAGAGDLVPSLDTVLSEGGKELSGGERQRICIARALYRESPILLFDEATSSLDGPAERAIAETIETLMGDRTVVVVSHRLSTVQRADRVLVLEGGRIVETGPPRTLWDEGGRFYALFSEAPLQ